MPSPANVLLTDPSYLAFLRSSGLSTSIAAADTARQRAAIRMALGDGIENLNRGGEQSRRNISTSLESRGQFRSGETLRRTAEQEAQQARARAALELNATAQLGGLETELAQRQADALYRGGEAALDADTRRYLDTLQLSNLEAELAGQQDQTLYGTPTNSPPTQTSRLEAAVAQQQAPPSGRVGAAAVGDIRTPQIGVVRPTRAAVPKPAVRGRVTAPGIRLRRGQ